jgi:hypothetical protein
MMIKTRSVHPLNENGERYEMKEILKEAETGVHGCLCSTTEKTEFDRFGVGINLYFRFLKTISKYFLLFFIISLPILIFGLFNFVNNRDLMKD